ncbi:glutathione S-transferase N-terminal domain-containing protein [Streptomyces sp. NPDC127084]|uniref:glutathione S-transferase N-terminal domain-containing protein n=1 Tax=Streptomyces sp. NPDC127084 TaxID=3347133 RepID=UPI00365CA19E
MATRTPGRNFLVHGLSCSYFTRKITGCLDYKSLPWRLKPSIGLNTEARALGWNGGIPTATTPEGEIIWDSTSIILHLDTRYPEPAVTPQDRLLAFLSHLLDDFSDEWFYRHAVGTRWLYEENTVSGSWDIVREGSREIVAPVADMRAFVTQAMTACLPRLGVTPQNIGAWVDESFLPWQRVFAAHLENHGYLLGGRPALCDFAFFGGNAGHFTNDPYCRRLTEEAGEAVVGHTHRLMAPEDQEFGDWFAPDALPDTLSDVLAEAGRHYLPWVAEATVKGTATVMFDNGSQADIPTTNFLNEARGIMLARYLEARTPELDAVLERAGILRYYADHIDQATSVPDPVSLPRPTDNRPYPAGE